MIKIACCLPELRLSKAIISCLIIGSAFPLISACDKSDTGPAKDIIRPAKIMTVGDPLAAAQRIYPGEVEAGDRSEQAFRVSGELIKLPAKSGMHVKKGQLLAQLDPSDFQLRIDEQQARFDLTNVQYERTKTLVKQQLIPRSDFDKAKSNWLAAKADLKLAKANFSYTELRAPFDGVISKVNIKNHENVRINQVVLIISTIDNINITFSLSENIISKIKRDRKKPHPKVVFSTYPDKFYETSVKEFDSEPDPQTRSYQVTLTLPTPKEFIALPGMSVNVHMDYTRLVKTDGSTIIIPVEAVLSPENTKLKSVTRNVWRVKRDSMEAQSTPVNIGKINSQGIEITSGLKAGDQIIIAGVNFIKEGQKVRPWVKEAGL